MSVNRYDPEDWGGLHMVPKPDGDWVCYEAWEHVNRQIAALKEENERLKARVAELAAPAVQGEPTDDELLNWAAEEQLFLLCEEDDFLQIAREVLHKYRSRSPAVQGGEV